jgi:hypothetical protein
MENLRYAIALRPTRLSHSICRASRHRVARSEVGHRRKNLGDLPLSKAFIQALFEPDIHDVASDAALNDDPKDPEEPPGRTGRR